MSKQAFRIVWAVAVAALVFAVVWFNLPPAEPAETADIQGMTSDGAEETAPEPSLSVSDLPLGHQEGELLPDFTLTTLAGETFTLSAQRGKVTVLNLWATWCTPCVKELPYFDQLQAAYPDDVAVLAIHSDLVTDDPAAYLAAFDYQIPFAVDETGQVIASMGGSTVLPQTLVLDADGVVTYNNPGSVTYEALEELVQAAMNRVSANK